MSSSVFVNGFNPFVNQGDDIPNDPGKMFIGGLSWQTTPESIREYFSSFGDLAEVMVMKDPATRRSRGFGFITFSGPTGVEKVLKYPVHQLDGKIVEPKVAVPRKTNPKLVMRTKKIFVGGLSATTSLEDIRAYFEQFSLVQDAMLAYDKVTNRHRGFGFVTFDNEDVVDKICEIHFHEINGKMVESKKALPKEPRLGYYNTYASAYYGGQGQMSPPGGRNYYGGGPNFHQSNGGGNGGGGGYMNGNRFYPQHPHFQGYYDRSNNSIEKANNGYNNHDVENTSSSRSNYYSKYNNNHNENNYYRSNSNPHVSHAGGNLDVSSHHHHHQQIQHQQLREKFDDMKFYNSELYSKLEGSSGSYSGGSGGNYEDDFPELATVTKLSQLRLSPVEPVPSSADFSF